MIIKFHSYVVTFTAKNRENEKYTSTVPVSSLSEDLARDDIRLWLKDKGHKLVQFELITKGV